MLLGLLVLASHAQHYFISLQYYYISVALCYELVRTPFSKWNMKSYQEKCASLCSTLSATAQTWCVAACGLLYPTKAIAQVADFPCQHCVNVRMNTLRQVHFTCDCLLLSFFQKERRKAKTGGTLLDCNTLFVEKHVGRATGRNLNEDWGQKVGQPHRWSRKRKEVVIGPTFHWFTLFFN